MIYLVDLEYVETRYTSQWKSEFPQSIADKTGQDIVVIEGPDDIRWAKTQNICIKIKNYLFRECGKHASLVKFNIIYSSN